MIIGEIIRQKIRESNRTAKEICEVMEMSRGNLDKIYHKDSLSTELLAKFCEVLKYDFFVHVNPNKYTPTTTRDYISEPDAPYVSEAAELRATKEKLRALERELTFMDQALADIKSHMRDKDEIIALMKDKLTFADEILANIRSGKGR